jgi:hypothetical protein
MAPLLDLCCISIESNPRNCRLVTSIEAWGFRLGGHVRMSYVTCIPHTRTEHVSAASICFLYDIYDLLALCFVYSTVSLI